MQHSLYLAALKLRRFFCRMRMEKKGIKKVSGFGHGDHYINIKVIITSILWRSLHHDQYQGDSHWIHDQEYCIAVIYRWWCLWVGELQSACLLFSEDIPHFCWSGSPWTPEHLRYLFWGLFVLIENCCSKTPQPFHIRNRTGVDLNRCLLEPKKNIHPLPV